ncbi:defense protein l(2)34Fc-like [Calliphora vicina]|uniref:defense protein l(2)34Fc-like n=1 Tax=Calliphora vicina TaxID=7373 RepID=UPI00325A6D1A
MLRFILLVCCLTAPVLGYSKGAPRSACRNGLMPRHRAEAQTTAAPYSFSGENSVKSGHTISLSLSGDKFLGFMIQAQNAKEEPVGRFKVIEANKSQLLRCAAEGDSLTHVQLHKKPITSVEFEWLAPADYKGPVIFVATVVKDYSTFWVRKVTKAVTVQ